MSHDKIVKKESGIELHQWDHNPIFASSTSLHQYHHQWSWKFGNCLAGIAASKWEAVLSTLPNDKTSSTPEMSSWSKLSLIPMLSLLPKTKPTRVFCQLGSTSVASTSLHNHNLLAQNCHVCPHNCQMSNQIHVTTDGTRRVFASMACNSCGTAQLHTNEKWSSNANPAFSNGPTFEVSSLVLHWQSIQTCLLKLQTCWHSQLNARI